MYRDIPFSVVFERDNLYIIFDPSELNTVTKLLFIHTGEKTSTEYLGACGLAKKNLSSLPSSNHLLTLYKRQKFVVSFRTSTQCAL